MTQAEMRLGVETLRQCRGDARLADTRFAGDQHDLAFAGRGARPAAQQQIDLLVAADQPGQRRSAQCLEPARDDTRTQRLPRRHRRGDALDLYSAEIAVFEEIADQPACARGDDDRVRLGQGLQTSGKVRRFADHRLFLRRAFADQIADDHQPGGDPDARLEFDGFDIKATDSVDGSQRRPDRALRIILMRSRVAKIDQDAVAHILGDKAIEPGDHLGDGAVIRGNDLAQILGIEPRRQLRRADQVAEHHRELPAFGIGSCRRVAGCYRHNGGRPLGTERGDGIQQLAPVADRCNADLSEIFRRQLRQHLPIDLIVAEGRHIALKAQTL
jgi:hypothetical protein